MFLRFVKTALTEVPQVALDSVAKRRRGET
jgi:hypothetical protein